MRKIIIRDHRDIHPFNEEARDLRIQNKPLWLIQRDTLAQYATQEIEVPHFNAIPRDNVETIVHRDNLYFDAEYLDAFIEAAKKLGGPCRAAFSPDNRAFVQHALPLSTSYTREDNLYLAELWYFPNGLQADPKPVVIDFQSREIGYYHVPTYMSTEKGDLVFQIPLRGLVAIDAWVHIYIADMVFGVFKRGARFEERINHDLLYKLRVLWRALLEAKQVLECSELVRIGRNCVIDPSAVIHGPTTIGDNCNIGAGAVIENCTIGDNVTISQGCQLMLSTIGDGTFLPFRAALFMTTLMENAIVAQNTCLQMCVIGRHTFIGAGNTFTDYNLLPAPLRALNANGELKEANAPVLGGCVGHNCRIGSGLVIYPARTIESDVVLIASKDRRVIDKNVAYEESDHHHSRAADLHKRLYPRKGEKVAETW
jgi:UDP-N-acetylglucosamine diphosphorylase / glucose-1-phosphate thymidylyltransferase / UDP-N-acetylgalactosamine diphosphorylase / glucosamine-1-phosphate N-acetyltransferase / galactosamine-1-phosphate N-acetyltransferase